MINYLNMLKCSARKCPPTRLVENAGKIQKFKNIISEEFTKLAQSDIKKEKKKRHR